MFYAQLTFLYLNASIMTAYFLQWQTVVSFSQAVITMFFPLIFTPCRLITFCIVTRILNWQPLIIILITELSVSLSQCFNGFWMAKTKSFPFHPFISYSFWLIREAAGGCIILYSLNLAAEAYCFRFSMQINLKMKTI